jgi:hypothetical protein
MDAITLENGQTVLPDWAKEVTLKKMASDMSKLSGTIKSENEKLIRAITGGKGSNKDANDASKATKENTKEKKKETEEIKKTTKEYSNMRGMSVSMGAAVGGVIGGLVKGVGALTGAIAGLTVGTLFKYTASLNRLTDVGLNQADEFMDNDAKLRIFGMSLGQATDFTLETAQAMQVLGMDTVAQLLGTFDRLTGSGADLGLTLEDNIDIFRRELVFATRLGNIGRLDAAQRENLVKRTRDLLETQIQYAGVLGTSVEVIRDFTLSMLDSSTDFQARLLLLNEDSRQELIKGTQEFVSVLRATGGSLGGELSAAALEAASFGAIGFSESAKRFVTVLPTLAGSFNNFIRDFNTGVVDGEEAAMMFTQTLGTLNEAEKQRIFAIARTGDAQALTMAKGIMEFEKSVDKLRKDGLDKISPVDFQRTFNLMQSAGTQIVSTFSAVKDKFIVNMVENINFDDFNNSFVALKNAVTEMAEIFFGIGGDAEKVSEQLGKTLPTYIDFVTVKIGKFNDRLQQFLNENKDAGFTKTFEKIVTPAIQSLMEIFGREWKVLMTGFTLRLRNAMPFTKKMSDEDIDRAKDAVRQKLIRESEERKVLDSANKSYQGSSLQDTVSSNLAGGNFNYDTDYPGLIRGSFAGDTGGYRFYTDSGYHGNPNSVQTRTLGSAELDKIEQAMLDKYLSLSSSSPGEAAGYLKELQRTANKRSLETGVGTTHSNEFMNSFDTDGTTGLSAEEFRTYLETLIMLTRRQTKTIEEGNM